MRSKSFVELAAELQGERALVVLDVDGTLVADGEDVMSEAVYAALCALARSTDVYVCSNKRREGRVLRLVAGTGAHALETRYRKPNPRVLASVEQTGKRVVVIGDKYLTDGLLAVCIRGAFYRVRTVRQVPESWTVTLALAVDAVFGRIAYDIARLVIR